MTKELTIDPELRDLLPITESTLNRFEQLVNQVMPERPIIAFDSSCLNDFIEIQLVSHDHRYLKLTHYSLENGLVEFDERGFQKVRLRERLAMLEVNWAAVDHIALQSIRNPTAPRKQKPRKRTGAGIYFIQSGSSGPIKIGYSTDITTRLEGFQMGCPIPLRVLAYIPEMSLKDERKLHRQFATSRCHGEWFNPSKELRKFIKEEATKW